MMVVWTEPETQEIRVCAWNTISKARPCAWLREQHDAFEGRQTLDPLFVLGDFRPCNFLNGATYEPLYDQAAFDAAVAELHDQAPEQRFTVRGQSRPVYFAHHHTGAGAHPLTGSNNGEQNEL